MSESSSIEIARPGSGPHGDVDIDVPAGWQVVEPPPGIALLALDPDEAAAFRSNLVVTMQPPPDTVSGPAPTSGDVDDYLATLLEAIDDQLRDVEVLGVWTSGQHPDAPERLATQRVLVAHRIDIEGCEAPVEVEMMQQHVWLDGEIVTLTATVPAGADQATLDTLNVCLESLTLVA